ncbi:OPT family oligopeptide transporter [Williamsia phyllosphaerae]|uniref:Oligopeptide transporter, OPT family protein n=1 Tax=Williamsia phyllosphaerae TaxID=885042 RepID=A0ABQ1V5T5_9NOCA|nr:oligopeptide transporter, OPT family [Williamsia phyllosphaerae]GGF38021.1 oligopeptide transporter, OPT family protein [Williamsia phyllosphaerae]
MSVVSSTRGSAVRELTLRGVVLGGLITLVFTAANVYLGLKVGLTFATSIPAAVISMSVLRYFANHSIVENNIVQTIASAAGTLSAIIFVLPGLIIVGYWSGFPYWVTAAVCATGGILGVAFSIPLRRALVTGTDLPFPEGVAGAEVLKVGTSDSAQAAADNKTGLRMLSVAALVAAGFSLVSSLKVISNAVSTSFKVGSGGTMVGASLSMALIGVGHLVGLTVAIAMVVGLVISYGILLPILTSGKLSGSEALADTVSATFSSDVRFIGAGAIAVAAVWTLVTIIRPIVTGIIESARSARLRRGGTEVDVVERDIPIQIVAGVAVFMLIPIGFLLWDFTSDTALNGGAAGIITVSLVYLLVFGLVIAAVCGYMAGLIGSSNSPLSGVGILVAISAALLIKVTFGDSGDTQTTALIAYTLFTTAVVFGVATISNDNLQDLKTGQLVGSTPWKQQVALVIGVLFGSAVIPPILQLMQTAFGFAGAPGAGDDALAAPQASLISSLVSGVFGDSLDWNLIGLGALIGAAVIAIDETMSRTTRFRLPPLAVGLGMYLPISLTLVIPIGAVLGFFYNRWADRNATNVERTKRLGVLLACGLIVGESLFGVVFAGIVAASGDDDPLRIVGEGFDNWAQVVGIVAFVLVLGWLYKRTQKVSETAAAKPDAV